MEDERIEELARVRKKCEKARVPFELVFSLPPGTKAVDGKVVDPEKDDEDDEDDPEKDDV